MPITVNKVSLKIRKCVFTRVHDPGFPCVCNILQQDKCALRTQTKEHVHGWRATKEKKLYIIGCVGFFFCFGREEGAAVPARCVGRRDEMLDFLSEFCFGRGLG